MQASQIKGLFIITIIIMAQTQKNSQLKQSIKAVPVSDSKKFLNHFESINSPIKIPPNFLSSNTPSTIKNKFSNAIQIYASPISASIIDKIADLPVKQSQVSYVDNVQNDFVRTPMIINLGSKIKQRVVNINNFFKREKPSFDTQQDDATLNGFIQNIINVDLSNTLPIVQLRQSRGGSNAHSKSRSKQSLKPISNEKKNKLPPHPTPPKQQIQKNQQQEVKIDPIVLTERTTSNKLKKMDLLLVQIIRQKKRKGLAPDYFRVIQMKLVQLLEYILQDEPQYFGLTLVDKMKEVLNNLQSFKGKSIDGQSKVNMLRIFFQQFRNLKKQRQQQIEGRENRSTSQSKKSYQKLQQRKRYQNQVVNSTQIYSKAKKSHDTLSMGGIRNQNKNSHKNPSSKSVKQEDQWIGSIDN